MNKQFRQGDVWIERIANADDEIGTAMKPVNRENGRVILAHGEVTGHAHAIASPKAALFMDTGTYGASASIDAGAPGLLKVDETVDLTHEEHDPISLEPGQYIVRRQREYEGSEHVARIVAD